MGELVNYLQEALNLWAEPLFLLNGRMQCVFANMAFCQLVGLLEPLRDPFPVEVHWPNVRQTDWNQENFVTELSTKSGSPIVVKIQAAPCVDGYRLCRIIGASSKDESKNFHTQRLETLGMLAGGVAHDFNNILTGILGHITYLKTILPQTGPHVESITAIEDGARRASNMTQQILDFSRLEVSDKTKPTDLGALVGRTCNLLRGAISPRFEMTWHLPSDQLSALVEESRMAQVVINLVINSRDAIQPGGHIDIALDQEKDIDAVSDAFGGSELLSRHYARLTVMDDGQGIPEKVLSRIFEPYFTTKEDRGTGLGLSTVRSIVRLFGGAIRVSSTEQKGTRVDVFLPLFQEPSREADKPKQSPTEVRNGLVGGNESILIIDDEYPVRNVLSVSLEHLGYTVTAVASGPEALALFKDDPEAYDLVLLDMLMPQMSGKEVFCELKKINPNIKVLAISGFTSEESIRFILENGGEGFVQKPFTIEDLSQRVRACF